MTTTSSTVCAASVRTWLDSSTVCPRRARVAQQGAQPADALRVEAVERLVEHQDLGVAEQRRRQPEPLAHAQRVRADAPARRVLEPDQVQHLVDAAAGSPASAASERRWSRAERPGWAPHGSM